MSKLISSSLIPRPPVVVIMGHIDHGKSSLLDYIRKTNIVDKEAGGITQHLSAYEVHHEKKGVNSANQITFLDTPGHHIFSKMRARGAHIADIAILVVSAEEGVKEQTKEALAIIKDARIPYIVAINKIDKPNANIERTKQNLAENEVYLEGSGGDVLFVPISAKVGTGVPELLDTLLLVAEMEDLKGNPSLPAEGTVVESHIVPARGTSATLIIGNGTLKKGMFILAEESLSPVRSIENFMGKDMDEASFSSPIQITGFDIPPRVGASFRAYPSKKEAEAARSLVKETSSDQIITKKDSRIMALSDEAVIVPLSIKTDVAGTLEAIEKELGKIERERIAIKIVATGIGAINENDVKLAASARGAIVIGFNTKIERGAQDIALRFDVTVKTFNVIYELLEWIESELNARTPKFLTEETTGSLKVLRIFSAVKHRQVIGGKVTTGSISINAQVKIMRRGVEVGRGKILELQQQKIASKKVDEGNECGMMVESKIEIASGDVLESFVMSER